MESITIFRKADSQLDLQRIQDFQIDQHIQNKTSETREEGFVTLLTTSDDLIRCKEKRFIYVAQNLEVYPSFTRRRRVLGYIVLMDRKIASGIGFLKPFIYEIEKLDIGKFSEDYLILAQILSVEKNKGIGSKLLGYAEERAIKNGARYLITEVSSWNPNSLKFHFKHGFKEQKSYKVAGQKFHIISKEI